MGRDFQATTIGAGLGAQREDFRGEVDRTRQRLGDALHNFDILPRAEGNDSTLDEKRRRTPQRELFRFRRRNDNESGLYVDKESRASPALLTFSMATTALGSGLGSAGSAGATLINAKLFCRPST